MSAHNNDASNDPDNLCVVCFKNVEIYSIGCCDHAVCFECSTRMRILCKQNECPICRRELPKVIFTRNVEPFSVMLSKFERSNLQDRKFGIIFCTSNIQKEYTKLLNHRCFICEAREPNWPFKTFQLLKEHMRKEHELFFCDICSEHLKIFSFERKCYNRQELAYHRRKGDKNNTSHRGHPLCEFCDSRFMDNDELFRHLRRNHFFCDFCDVDGKHQYYNSMEDLKRHFKDEHYLCEEGDCKTMPLTAVFRSDIDLKAHITVEHGRYMSKSASRQARTLELEFTMAPRPRSDNMRSRRLNENNRDRFEDDNAYSLDLGGATSGSSSQAQLFVNPLTSDQFPALGGSSDNANNITVVSKNFTKFSNSALNSNDFPSLGGSSTRSAPALTITANSAGSSAPEVTITRTVGSKQPARKPKPAFPALGSANKPPGSSTVRLSVNSGNQQQIPKVSIQVNQKSNGAITTHITSAPSTSQRTEVFPALGKSSQPSLHPQWVQPKPKKQEQPKAEKVSPCPVLETADFNSFPSLSKGKSDKPKKTSSVTVPVDSWVNLNSIKATSKNPKKLDSNNNKGDTSTEKAGQNSKKAGESHNGGSSSYAKKNETSKKNNAKAQSNTNNMQSKPVLSNAGPAQNANTKSQQSETLSRTVSNLQAKLDALKFVEVGKPEGKSKKKKNKSNGDTNGNISETVSEFNSQQLKENKKNIEIDTPDMNDNQSSLNDEGVAKMRSELKIGTLSKSGRNDEFPVLGSTKPPPGFSSKSVLSQNTVKPPPGFVHSNFPPLSQSNDLTFTNSSGQSYAISPTQSQFTYKQPRNFMNRNQNLIKRIMEVLNDNDLMRDFKTLSDSFRHGTTDARKYYERCQIILGNKFDEIFSELLILLPDIEKQQDLYNQMSGKTKDSVVVCENCKQIIFKRELSEHYDYHKLENHFPALGMAQQIPSAWKK
ncbi:E3 ubiquitin-protein ligase ZNF598 [Dendroctonus ponderosae]|uniref:E3 ubiquitin-protein ligase ZNF598 n=1 Tax=Dendroctonus ponderosae TaxID=77166 RepID=UPI0020363721|nr:E3 ubiquitin-protein ligase ZNF598 [Dendroctonus ponderosae]KAH1025482.1 hypothetical protein HUJ05_010203 [Dendroctonus ponderosae]